MAYDDVGNRTQITDRNSRVRSFTYDGLNRETAENWLNATNNPIRTITSTYDAANQLISVKDPDSTYKFSYDPKGRQIAVDNTGTNGVPNVLLNYTYDDQDNLLSVKDTINGAAKGTTAYTYDTLNRISQISQSGNGVASKRVDFGYDNVGQIKSVNRYSDLSGSQLVRGTTYTYDAKNRLDVLSHGSGVSYDFDYDNGNRITKITDVDGVTNYSYDKNNQLTVADYSSSDRADEGFSYDGNGNRTNSGYQTGTNNRLQSDGKFNYAYDDEGNLIRKTEIATNKVTEYEWDYRNRLAGVFDKDAAGDVTQEVGFKYDAMNRRIAKKVGSNETRFVYDRDNVLFDFVAEGSNQPVLDQRYLFGTGVDQLLAQEKGNGDVLWALSDQLGTVADWVDDSGSVANHVVYDAFGGVVDESDSGFGSRYGFTGRELDEETGLYYYRSRYYDGAIGRFIGEDSVGFGGGDSNLYRYVANRPLDNVDPFGLFKIDVHYWPVGIEDIPFVGKLLTKFINAYHIDIDVTDEAGTRVYFAGPADEGKAKRLEPTNIIAGRKGPGNSRGRDIVQNVYDDKTICPNQDIENKIWTTFKNIEFANIEYYALGEIKLPFSKKGPGPNSNSSAYYVLRNLKPSVSELKIPIPPKVWSPGWRIDPFRRKPWI
ncbi:RHS repeat domain-containing protein [Phormidium nigroviride]